jgi:hypothetical protein
MARQPVGIAVAMARHPQQLHFVKTCQRVLGVGDQRQQAGDEGALAAGDLADGDTLSPRTKSAARQPRLPKPTRHARHAARPRCCSR